ncbi:MAG: carbohydrate ABC transporter permease [Oscillospiraceae bacterium]|nr:carbohydrate ABC transporter permease [Oscillospiraceae bacterium]
MKIKRHHTWDDKILYWSTDIVLVVLLLIVAYPIIYVLSNSFSSGIAVSSGRVLLWPVEPSLKGYEVIFAYKSVWVGFANSIFYTVCGTTINMVLSVLAAYPLSRHNYQGRGVVTVMFTMTMIFSAGMIPTYLLMSKLHLTNSRLGILLSGAISAYNMIIIRTYFKSSIPGELIEAARIDGCSELRTLFSVVLPLSKAVLSVVTLYYAVAHWNNYFTCMLYLRDESKQPLQIVLRNILDAQQVDQMVTDPELRRQMAGMADLIKYCLIVVTSAPIIAMYPFVQKFFEKGVMIGSVKG